MQTKLIALTFILQAIAILSLAYAVYSQRKTIILLKERTLSLHLTQCAMQDTIKFISEWIKSEIRMQDLARSKEEYETSQKLKDIEKQIIAEEKIYQSFKAYMKQNIKAQ